MSSWLYKVARKEHSASTLPAIPEQKVPETNVPCPILIVSIHNLACPSVRLDHSLYGPFVVCKLVESTKIMVELMRPNDCGVYVGTGTFDSLSESADYMEFEFDEDEPVTFSEEELAEAAANLGLGPEELAEAAAALRLNPEELAEAAANPELGPSESTDEYVPIYWYRCTKSLCSKWRARPVEWLPRSEGARLPRFTCKADGKDCMDTCDCKEWGHDEECSCT